MTYATLMVHLRVGQPYESLLKVTDDLARRFNAGVIGVAACRPMEIIYSDGYVPANLIQQNHDQFAAEIAAAKDAFHRALSKPGRSLDWRSPLFYESLADYAAQQARVADLIIAPSNGHAAIAASTEHVETGNLVMQAGRPVIVVPPHVDRLHLDHVMVGWKDTRETRRAISDALPMLRAAARVTMFEIAREDELGAARLRLRDVTNWLGHHGIEVNSIASSCIGEDASGLSAIVKEQGADLIVAGAYGHSRMREWALGGVTRDLLLHPDRCVFLSH